MSALQGVQTPSQVFSWRNLETQIVKHYHVGRLIEAIQANRQAYELRWFACDIALAEKLIAIETVELRHLLRIAELAKRPEGMAALLTPGIMMETHHLDHNEHVIMDGNHRFCTLSKAKRKAMEFWVVSPEQAAIAEIDMPDWLVPV